MSCKQWSFLWGFVMFAFLVMLAVLTTALPAEGSEPQARERVFDLPQDSDKWFVSVVGLEGDQHFAQILGWFNSNGDLAELKAQVHFHKITTDSTAFKDRYAKNTPDFPMIRLQRADGYVAYEVAGGAVPDTDTDLLTEISMACLQAGGPIFNRDGRVFPIFPVFRRPLLPYRYRQQQKEDECDTCPTPQPVDVSPVVIVQPKPTPKEPDSSLAVVIVLMALSLAAGGAGGIIAQWKKLYYSVE